MDGPSHYREAGRLEAVALAQYEADHVALSAITMQQAHVHATLALAAATAISAPMPNRASTTDAAAWRQVAGVEEVHS